MNSAEELIELCGEFVCDKHDHECPQLEQAYNGQRQMVRMAIGKYISLDELLEVSSAAKELANGYEIDQDDNQFSRRLLKAMSQLEAKWAENTPVLAIHPTNTLDPIRAGEG